MTQLLSLCSTAWSYLPHILSVFFSSYSWWIFISFTEGREQANFHLLASFPLCFFMIWPFIYSLYLYHFLQLSLQARSHWDQRKEEMERGKPKPPRTRLSHAFFSFLLNLSQSSSKYLFNISHLFASLRPFSYFPLTCTIFYPNHISFCPFSSFGLLYSEYLPLQMTLAHGTPRSNTWGTCKRCPWMIH